MAEGVSEKAIPGQQVSGLVGKNSLPATAGASESNTRLSAAQSLESSLAGGELKNALGNSKGTPFKNITSSNGIPLGDRGVSTGQTQLSGALFGGKEAESTGDLMEAAGRMLSQSGTSAKSAAQLSPGSAQISNSVPGQNLGQGFGQKTFGNSQALSLGASTLAAESVGVAGKAAASTAAAATTSARAELVQQVVRNATLMVRNGRPEIRIDLKPESLGSIKLHITTVDQQVQVKIMAQTQVVKEILESSLNQLKNDLLNQKLDVERFDVTVAGEENRGFGDAKQWESSQRAETKDSQDRNIDGEDSQPSGPNPRSQHHTDRISSGRVDYFV
jgi:flagellar hook-length control protein FliK